MEPEGGASAASGRTIKVGGFRGGRPSLAELRKLNAPGVWRCFGSLSVGPEEQVGGEKNAK